MIDDWTLDHNGESNGLNWRLSSEIEILKPLLLVYQASGIISSSTKILIFGLKSSLSWTNKMASLARLINTLPVPLFGSVRTATAFTFAKVKASPKFAGWAVPLGIGALWFVWPAVDDEWKIEMGLKADPEAAAKAAATAAEAAKNAEPVKLSPEAVAKVEVAYKAHVVEETEDDKAFVKAAKSGDFTYLEETWEGHMNKAIKPGEDDDDDEDEEDEEDEEEEEEEGDDDDDE